MGDTDDQTRKGLPLGAPGLAVLRPHDGVSHADKIVIEDLDFYYGETRARRKVCLAIQEHQVTGLIGPSGCGKSTLLRVLDRLYNQYPGQRATGSVRLDGQEILGPAVDLQALRGRIGMVFQESTVFPMSIRDNLVFGTRLHDRLSHAELAARIEDILIRVDLWAEVKDRLHAPASALSGGQQQRLCIARALTTRPEVLLMDEPTSALDAASMARVEELIDTLKATVTIVLVTHNLQQAARCADRVAFFYLGELVETGSALQMFTEPRSPRTSDFVTGRFG